MTSAELVERALREINPAPTPEERLSLWSTLEVRVESSLRLLAERVVHTNLLRKSVAVTATDGEASLASVIDVTGPIILESLPRASIYIDGFTLPAQYAADRSSLLLDQTFEFARWTLENQTLILRDGVGLGNYDGTVTIRNAPYVPTLGTVPASLETLLVQILAGVPHAKTTAQVATAV